MLLCLCAPDDRAAQWFTTELRRRHGVQARIVTPQELVYAPDMHLRSDGTASSSSVTLKSVGPLDSASITGVINRIAFLPDGHLANVAATDRTYIQQELLAIWSSWISALPCTVLNRPTATSISGPMYHPAVWHHSAAAAGLPVAQLTYDADLPDPVPPTPVQSAIVCQGQCHSASLPPALFGACCDLAAFAGLDMVELFFGAGPDGPVFSAASPIPDLGRADSALLAQVAQIFHGAAP